MTSILDFIITVNSAGPGYTVEARAPGEVMIAPLPASFDASPELKKTLEGMHAGDPPPADQMQPVGAWLYNAIFPRKVALAYARALGDLALGDILRLKLNIRPPELSSLPWELLYDPDEEKYAAARLTCPIVRLVESATPAASLLARKPLRLLYVAAQPSDLKPLDLEASRLALHAALGGSAEIIELQHATADSLRTALSQPFHILHFDGHAAFDRDANTGSLFLEDTNGLAASLGSDVLATFLDGTPIRLVVLAACESGTGSVHRRFAGIAEQVMSSSSLPAVVAMQFAIPDESAIAFTHGFYGALAQDSPVDAALTEGRKAILGTLGPQPYSASDWATPILFLRLPDGDIFRPQTPVVLPGNTLQQATGGLQALSELIQGSSEARTAAIEFRTDFQASCSQLDILGDYKDLHDLLHQLQYNCYDGILNEAPRFPGDERSMDMLLDYSLSLEGVLNGLRQVLLRGRVGAAETQWVNLLGEAFTDLKTALSQQDAALLKKMAARLNRILFVQPPRINQCLNTSAATLRLPALVDALSRILNSLLPLNLDAAKIQQFQAGLGALSSQNQQLQALVSEHESWQSLDVELRRIEGMGEGLMDELDLSWVDVKAQAEALYTGRTEAWAAELKADGQALETGQASANPVQIRRAFRSFRRRVGEHFYKVDFDLKNLCGELRQVGSPLTSILNLLG